MGVDCLDEEVYPAIRQAAWFTLFVYVIGIPMVCVLLLKKASAAILSERPTNLSRALLFFHGDYEPRWYYWEIVETYRKLWLVGFMSIILPGRVLQLGIAMIFSLVLLLFTCFAEPYQRRDSDFYAI